MAADESGFWAEHYDTGTDENLRALAELLKPWRCCGAPQLCGARCQDDEFSAGLANAERLVRAAIEQEDRR